MEAKAGRREPSPSDSREPPLICTQNLTRIFGSGETAVAAVNEVTLDVPRGEFLAITGRSGSGKTTLLNLMAGLDQPTSGSVSFDGRDLVAMAEAELVSLRRHRVGFVFQSFGLMPLLSAFENVELPLHIGGIPWRERRKRATEALEMVGLGARARHRPYELSGGEQQRVAIARALVHGPDVVFADEPTGELDSRHSRFYPLSPAGHSHLPGGHGYRRDTRPQPPGHHRPSCGTNGRHTPGIVGAIRNPTPRCLGPRALPASGTLTFG